MIEVHYLGNLGERLIQYLVCRYLAESWGYALEAAPIAGFPETYKRIPGASFLSPCFHVQGDGMRCIEKGDELSSCWPGPAPEGRVIVQSYCQSKELLMSAVRHAQDWLYPQFRLRKPSEGTVTVACHFAEPRLHTERRIGHLRTRKNELQYIWPSAKEITDLLDQGPCTMLKIFTDRPNAPVWEELPKSLRCQIIDGGPQHNFREILSARKIIFANTAFDWISAKTSNAEILVPATTPEDHFTIL